MEAAGSSGETATGELASFYTCVNRARMGQGDLVSGEPFSGRLSLGRRRVRPWDSRCPRQAEGLERDC